MTPLKDDALSPKPTSTASPLRQKAAPTRPRSSAAEADRRYFRQAYRNGRHGWGVEEPSSYAVEFLGRLKGIIPGGRLLDIGCGEGRHAIIAAKLGLQGHRCRLRAPGPGTRPTFRQGKGNGGTRSSEGPACSACRRPSCPSTSSWTTGASTTRERRTGRLTRRAFFACCLATGTISCPSSARSSPCSAAADGNGTSPRAPIGAVSHAARSSSLFGGEFEAVEMVEEGAGHGFWHALFRRRP